MKILEDWYVHVITLHKGTPKEFKIPMLCGQIDGVERCMVRITGFDTNTLVCSSKQTKFLLGEPKKEYEERFPNAKQAMHEGLARAVTHHKEES